MSDFSRQNRFSTYYLQVSSPGSVSISRRLRCLLIHVARLIAEKGGVDKHQGVFVEKPLRLKDLVIDGSSSRGNYVSAALRHTGDELLEVFGVEQVPVSLDLLKSSSSLLHPRFRIRRSSSLHRFSIGLRSGD